jgi:hypothetical protein
MVQQPRPDGKQALAEQIRDCQEDKPVLRAEGDRSCFTAQNKSADWSKD